MPLTNPPEGGATVWGGITGTLASQTDLQSALDAKQATLVSATNIKTINGSTVLGSGDLVVSGSGAAWGGITGTLASQTDLQTALDGKLATNGNGSSLTGLTKAQVGLSNVDDTTDAGKPVSTAQQNALNLKATIATPAFTGATLTLADAQDVVINATTGSKIGQSASKIGFFGVTPAVRPTAITQTYSTATSTHANVTQLAAPAGGVGTAAGGWSTAANRDLAITSINAARTDIANVKQVLNQVIDQLQALGLLQ